MHTQKLLYKLTTKVLYILNEYWPTALLYLHTDIYSTNKTKKYCTCLFPRQEM